MTGEDFKLQAPAPTSTRVRRRRPADRDHGVHGQGLDKFEDITRGPRIRGLQRAQHFAIVLDREIKTLPQIDFTDRA